MKPERVWKAIKTIRKEKETKEIVGALGQIDTHSTHFLVSVAPTSATLNDLEKCIASLSLSGKQATETTQVAIHDYSHSPLSPTKSFIERPELSSKFKESLSGDSENDGAEPVLVVVYGLGGAGKSQLVLNHVKKHRKHYTATFWIEAGNAQSLERDFYQVYRILYNLQGMHSHQLPRLDEVITLLKNWFLQRDGKWLIVFDEMDSLFERENSRANHFHTWLPATRIVHVIMTTRDSRAADLTTLEAIEVDCMDKEEASALFKSCAGLMTNQEDHHVHEIVEELGFFALAVRLAGYYVKQTPWLSSDLGRYLPQYWQKQKEILSEQPRQAVHYYKQSILTTWETSFSAVEARSSGAADLFLLVSWLNPNDIFEEIFSGVLIPANEMNPDQVETLSLFKSTILWPTEASIDMHSVSSCFRNLQDYSLVRWESASRSFRIHTLFQVWAQDRLGTQSQEYFIELAVELLTAAIHLVPGDCRLRDRLVSQLDRMCHTIYERLRERLDSQKIVSKGLLECLQRIDGVFCKLGRFALLKAVRHLKAEFTALRFEYLNPRTLKAKSNLAKSYSACGLLQTARELYEHVLNLQSQLLGEEHKDSIYSLTGLASVSFHERDWRTAIKLQKLALQRWQTRRIEYSNEILEAQARLARYLGLYGDFDGAAALSEEVLTARSQLDTVDEKELQDAMRARAMDYEDAGFFEKAHSMFVEVLAKRQALLGDLHAETLMAISQVAISLGKMGRTAEQERLQLAALEGAKKGYGDTHPYTLIHLNQLARCVGSRGDHRRAIALYTECIMFSYHFRKEFPYRCLSRHDGLADALQCCGDYQYAIKVVQEAYFKLSSRRDTDFVVVLKILSGHIFELISRRDNLAAIALAREFQNVMQRDWGEGHARTLLASRELIWALMHNDQYVEAQPLQ